MLNMKYTRIFLTESRPVMPSYKIGEEGMALVEDIDGNETKVRPSSGAAGEIFAGVSLSRNAPPSLIPNVEEFTVPAALVKSLARTPVSGQLLVTIDGTAATIVAGTPAANQVKLNGNTLTFHTSANAASVFVQYLYEPSLKEARTLTGDAPIGGLAAVAQSVVGAIVRGEFATNFFDASCDWSDALQVRLGAGGIFTTKGSGTLLSNVTIRSRPSSENSMLVLAIN